MNFISKKINQSNQSCFRSADGFTLLEVLLALTIFSIGILAVMTLSDANIRLARENADRVLAANLAREGIELVRNMRDSNWLKIEGNQTDCGGGNICPWDYHLHPENNSGFFAIDYKSTIPITSGDCNTWDSCFTGSGDIGRIYLNISTGNPDSGFYSNDVSGQITSFSRIMKIRSICLLDHAEDIDDGDCVSSGKGEKIGLEVTARVRWQRHSKTNELDVTEHLYNWRY